MKRYLQENLKPANVLQRFGFPLSLKQHHMHQPFQKQIEIWFTVSRLLNKPRHLFASYKSVLLL